MTTPRREPAAPAPAATTEDARPIYRLPALCPHEDFHAEVDVHRLIDTGRFQADVRIRCKQCLTPFRFIGLPCGLDLNGAAVNPDGTEGRFAVAPKGEVVSILEGAAAGFTVRRES